MKKPAKERKKRGPRGRGTVFYSKSRALWIARIPVGKSANGRTRYLERGDKTQAGALAKLQSARPPGPGTTVREWGQQWLAASSARPSSLDDMKHTLEAFINPELGHLRLTDVTAHHVEMAARRWGKPVGPLNPNTLKKNIGQLGSLFSAARRARLVTENPVSLARKPKAKRVDIYPFTASEVNRIIAAAKTDTTRPFAVLAVLGCRVGELLALDVQDVKGDTVSITKTYTRKHGIRPPKSERGNRVVRVAAPGLPALRHSVGKRKRGPLFLTAAGGRRHHDGMRRVWLWLLKKLGIPFRSIHTLRHTWISLSIAAGVGIAEVARTVGDTPQTILTRYAHSTGVDAVAAYEGILSAGKPASLRP